MTDAPLDTPEVDDFERPSKLKAIALLVSAVLLLLIPVIIGWRMSNTDSSDDLASSGMDTAPTTIDDAVTEQLTTYNVALGGSIIDVSSEFSDEFAAAFAIDGDLNTEWSSAGDGNDAFIVIDLSEPRQITGIGFRTRELPDGSAITNRYDVRIDGAETFESLEAGPGLVVTQLVTRGQFVRIALTSTTGGNTGAVEIEIYGR